MQAVSTAFPAEAQIMPSKCPKPERGVHGFLDNVRSGRNPEAAAIYMAREVTAGESSYPVTEQASFDRNRTDRIDLGCLSRS